MLSTCHIPHWPRSPWHRSTRAQGQWQHENEERSRLEGGGDAYRREASHKVTKEPRGFSLLRQYPHLSSSWLLFIANTLTYNVAINVDIKVTKTLDLVLWTFWYEFKRFLEKDLTEDTWILVYLNTGCMACLADVNVAVYRPIVRYRLTVMWEPVVITNTDLMCFYPVTTTAKVLLQAGLVPAARQAA